MKTLLRITTALVVALLFGIALTTTSYADHGPACEDPREEVADWLKSYPEEWSNYDLDGDGRACEATHSLTRQDLRVSEEERAEVEDTQEGVTDPVVEGDTLPKTGSGNFVLVGGLGIAGIALVVIGVTLIRRRPQQ